MQVLWHPELPLHNKASELAVRRRVRKRDVSFGPRSGVGAAAWDTFQTIAATAQKLGVSFIAYVADRVSGRNALPSLASLITERARELNLGAPQGVDFSRPIEQIRTGRRQPTEHIASIKTKRTMSPSYNPNRIDRRNGRVNRFGKHAPMGYTLTLYGNETIDKGLTQAKVFEQPL